MNELFLGYIFEELFRPFLQYRYIFDVATFLQV